MADEITKAIDTAEAATKTAEAAVVDTAEKTASTAKTATKKAAKAVAPKTTKTKKTARRAKAKRSTRRAQPTQRAAAATEERTKEMNFDSKNWFAGFTAPTAPFQNLFADAGERGQEVVRRTQQTGEEIADLTRANVEALVEAGRITAEGVRSLGQEVVESGREGVEKTADAVRMLAEAKSPTEFVQLQTELARSSFDRMVAESSRLTESMVKLAGEAIQPISSRASVNAERLNKLVA